MTEPVLLLFKASGVPAHPDPVQPVQEPPPWDPEPSWDKDGEQEELPLEAVSQNAASDDAEKRDTEVPDAPRMGMADQHLAAQRMAKAGVAVRLLDPERPHLAHLVGRDLSDPALWRHTLLVDDRPYQDDEFTKAEDAFLAALQAGGIPAHTDASVDVETNPAL